MATKPAPSSRRRGGRPARADAALLGASILKAAEDEFFAQGFGGARMEAIAEAAGTTKQTLYTRYGSKETLFIAVSNGILRDRFMLPSESGGSLRDQLVHLADQMLDAILDPKLVRMSTIITSEAMRFPELARMSDEDETFPVRTMMERVLSTAAARGLIHCKDPHDSMLMLHTMIMSSPLRAAQLGIGFAREKQRSWARFAVDLFLEGAYPRTQVPQG